MERPDTARELDSTEMNLTVHARVKNGRLIVDEPTDLPEGTELVLVPAAQEVPATEGRPSASGAAVSAGEQRQAWDDWVRRGPDGPIEDDEDSAGQTCSSR